MDYAYYASDWIWPSGSSDLMKSMLLFFDKIAMALPPDLAAETIERDQILAVPLFEKGFLVNFDPNDVLDEDSARKLIETLTALVMHADPNRLSGVPRMSITLSHWGHQRAPEAARAFESALVDRGLMTETGVGDLVWLPANMRLLVLVLFAQMLRGRHLGSDVIVHPVTDNDWLAAGLENFLGKFDMGGSSIVAPRWLSTRPDPMDPWQMEADLLEVGADLSAVPLDEVLDFKQEYGAHYRAYAESLRQFLETSAGYSAAERRRAQNERRERIRDQADELRRISRRAFGVQTGTLALALVGIAMTLGTPLPAVLAALVAILQMVPTSKDNLTAYSYLLKTRDLH
jgi:hypothetical protein